MTNSLSPKPARSRLHLVFKLLLCLIMLAQSCVLGMLTFHFFHRGGDILAILSATALVSAGIFALSRNKILLMVGTVLAAITSLVTLALTLGFY